MIEEKNIKIVPIKREDLEFLSELRQDPVVYNNLGTFIIPNEARQSAWFNSLSSPEKEFLIVEVFENERWSKAGLVRLTDIDNVNRSVCVGADLHKNFRGRGFAKDVYGLIIALCFKKMNMNRLWLLVMSTNTIAKKLYLSLGFEKEGIQREAILRDGHFVDYEMFSLLRRDYKEK